MPYVIQYAYLSYCENKLLKNNIIIDYCLTVSKTRDRLKIKPLIINLANALFIRGLTQILN